MPSGITARIIRTVSSSTGITERAIDRIIGTIRVKLKSAKNETESSTTAEYELGLRLNQELNISLIGEDEACAAFTHICSNYYKLCPQIINWIQRGDFNPEIIPDKITRGILIHGSRTAGRLRSSLLRSQWKNYQSMSK